MSGHYACRECGRWLVDEWSSTGHKTGCTKDPKWEAESTRRSLELGHPPHDPEGPKSKDDTRGHS